MKIKSLPVFGVAESGPATTGSTAGDREAFQRFFEKRGELSAAERRRKLKEFHAAKREGKK